MPDDFTAQDNTVRIVDAFINELDLVALGFQGATPAATGRPSYHSAVLLKLYLYGYLNRVQSSRRLERECQRNVELMWLTGRLAPDFKTIADFRRDNGKGNESVPAHQAVGTRRGHGQGSATVGPDASRHDGAQEYRRACLQHPQALDGLDALPDPHRRHVAPEVPIDNDHLERQIKP